MRLHYSRPRFLNLLITFGIDKNNLPSAKSLGSECGQVHSYIYNLNEAALLAPALTIILFISFLLFKFAPCKRSDLKCGQVHSYIFNIK